MRDLMGIKQTSMAVRQPNARGPAKRKAMRTRRAIRTAAPGRVERYITHAVVLAVSIAIVAHNPAPLIVMLGAGFMGVALLFGAKDAMSSAIAFRLRGRPKTGS